VKKLHIDIETYSSTSIKDAGAYKYSEALDFEILIFAYAYDAEPVQAVELARGEKIPARVIADLTAPTVQKWAHNATFERVCIAAALGINIPISQIFCSAIKAASCGLPLSLAKVSEALQLGDKAKNKEGAALIRYFSIPVKATQTNGGRVRNLPEHDPERWERFVAYCVQDVEAERAIADKLEPYSWTRRERLNYIANEQINDRGVLIDLDMAAQAVQLDKDNQLRALGRLAKLTGLKNPNSPAQLKSWLSLKLKKEIKSLNKDFLPELLERAEALGLVEVVEALQLRRETGKTSVKKYEAMINSASDDDQRARGLFQFYGASRTGRWAGRLVQLQNLPQNKVKELDEARWLVATGDAEGLVASFGSISNMLSQTIRTALIAPKGRVFAVADYSAIEARVIAWLAGEAWRLEVFATHGKIYEASAAQMFNVPVESIDKSNPLRARGKIAELALGYGGSVGALKAMGGEKMGLTGSDMQSIVKKWRKANRAIVKLWRLLEDTAVRAVKTRRGWVVLELPFTRLGFICDDYALRISLPSGRELFYKGVQLREGKWGGLAITYEGTETMTHRWGRLETYGGKLAENIVQAVARDILADALRNLHAEGFEVVMHVHDEAIAEVSEARAAAELERMEQIMATPPQWSRGLNLPAEGYTTQYYKKD